MSTEEVAAAEEPRRHVAITAASLLFYRTLVGAIPIGAIAAYVAVTRTHPIIISFPALSGPLEDLIGLDASIAYATLWVAVSALGLPAGYRFWHSQRKGGKLALILVPFGTGFGICFGAPAYLVAYPLLLIFLALGWKTLL